MAEKDDNWDDDEGYEGAFNTRISPKVDMTKMSSPIA